MTASNHFGFWLALAIYFLPSIIAGARQCHRREAIIATNILLGWTVIFWVVTLYQACVD